MVVDIANGRTVDVTLLSFGSFTEGVGLTIGDAVDIDIDEALLPFDTFPEIVGKGLGGFGSGCVNTIATVIVITRSNKITIIFFQ